MKKFLFALLFLLPVIGFATITTQEEYSINHIGGPFQQFKVGTLLAKTPNVVVGKYSFGVSGQTATSGDVNLLRNLKDSGSTIVIPDNAIINNVFVDVLTQPVGSSVAVKISSAGDLLTETAEGSLTIGLYKGIPDTATAADWIKLSADKTLKATLNGTATAGKFNVYVEYYLGD